MTAPLSTPGTLCRGGCGAPAAFYCDDCYKRVLTERGGAIDFEIENKRAREATLDRRLKEAGVPLRYRTGEASLDTYVPKTRGQMDALAAVRDLLAGKPPYALLLVGPNGTGKTHLAASAVAQIVRGGGDACFTTHQDLLLKIKATFGGGEDSEWNLVRTHRSYAFLAQDDIAVEQTTAFAAGTLFNVLNYRIDEALPTILTTNVKPGALAQKIAGADGQVMAERIMSRLIGEGLTVEIEGPDQRQKRRKST